MKACQGQMLFWVAYCLPIVAEIINTHPIKEDVKKKILPPPLGGDVSVVTCIQPRLIPRGVVGLAALDRRAFQRRCQPQLLVPTRRFHEAVVLDAIRLRSYAS